MLYDTDNETFPNPLKYVDVMRQTQMSIKKVSEHVINDICTEAKGVNLSEVWNGTTRLQILRTRLLEGHKWVNGRPAKSPKDHQTRQYIYGLKPGYGLPRNKDKTNAEWAQKGAKLQAARRDRGIYEVLTDDKHYFKVIADARLKLEKDTALALPCIVRKTVGENLRLEQLKPIRSSQFQKKKSIWNKREHVDHIAEKGDVECFTVAWCISQSVSKKL